jgi:predicted permease
MPVRTASLDLLSRDLTLAARQLRSARAFTVAAILTLAVGIGATAAVFSLLNAVVLHPLPFAEPDRVVNLRPARDGTALLASSGLEFATWRALPGVFSAVAASTPGVPFVLDHGDRPTVVTGTRATAGIGRVLGVAPELGRGFTEADDQPGAPRVVILGHKLWAEQFQRDRAIVGRTIRLGNDTYAVIGVMPASLDPVSNGDVLWTPLALTTDALQDFRTRSLQVTARLAPTVSLAQAASAVDAAERRLAAERPMWGPNSSAQAHRFADDLIGNLRSRLFILLGAVSFVFLIACVNVANLLLARGNTRTREMAVRTALGAARGRLVRQLLTESAVLCLFAGALGAALAYALVRGLVAVSPPGVPRIEEARMDGMALLFTLAVSAVCSVVVGLLPAVRVAGAALHATLREGGRGSSESRSSERGRSLLMAAELALAMTLLSGAALLIRSAWEIGRVDPGFNSDRVLTAQMLLPAARYPDLATGARAYRQIQDEIARVPGVSSTAFTSSLPLAGGVRAGIGAEGHPMTDGGRFIADLRLVSPGYFRAIGMRLQSGRDFTRTDDAAAPKVAIVNETLARKFWPNQNPIGKRFEGMNPNHQNFMEVIGVVADAHNVGLDQAPAAEFYIPLEQMPPAMWAIAGPGLTVVARTAPAPATMERAVRNAVAAVDPSLPVANVATMESVVRGSRAAARFNLLLLSALGAIALVLATVGVYGVIAYSNSQRTREIGLRLALGASPAGIAALVGRRALAPIVAGTIAGGVLALLTTRLLREQLFGVAPGDPLTLTAIAALLLAISFVAALIPVRRAMRVPPVVALAG